MYTCMYVYTAADKAAKELAQVLASKVHGNRPVTLIGFGEISQKSTHHQVNP